MGVRAWSMDAIEHTARCGGPPAERENWGHGAYIGAAIKFSDPISTDTGAAGADVDQIHSQGGVDKTSQMSPPPMVFSSPLSKYRGGNTTGPLCQDPDSCGICDGLCVLCSIAPERRVHRYTSGPPRGQCCTVSRVYRRYSAKLNYLRGP